MGPYTSGWRTAVRPGARSSAAALAPHILGLLPNRPCLIDVGCGEGWLMRELADGGADVTGVEADSLPQHDDLRVIRLNLNLPPYPRVENRFDAAVCLEVGEHLTPSVAQALVDWLCELAPLVIFSAAVPGQGGPGHINERWPAYWRDLFATNGYEGTGALRWSIWEDDRIEPWYRQNTLLFADDLNAVALDADGCPAVVHPAMWAHHGHR